MTDADLTPFLDTFRELRGVLVHRRLAEDEESRQETAYFHALRRYHFRDVRGAADTLLRSSTKFPAPAEWIAALPKATPDARQLRSSEEREWRRAADLGWEDDPCGCVACAQAGVTHRRLRFVPTVDDTTGTVEQAVDPNSGQVVTPGHWAHGEELARWYETRERFLATARRTGGGLAIVARAVSREPGSDDE